VNEDGLDEWVDFIGDLDVVIKGKALGEEKQILSQLSFCIQTHLVANYYIDGQLGKQMMTK
jgi:hypothetical protein